MKGKRRKIRKWIFDNIVGIIALFYSVIHDLIVYFGGNEVSKGIFHIIVNFLIILCLHRVLNYMLIIRKKYKKCIAKRKRLREEVERYGDTSEYTYEYQKEELWQEFLAYCLAMAVLKARRFVVLIVIIIVVCMLNPQDAYAYWNEWGALIGFRQEEVSISDEKTIEEVEEALADVDTEEPTRTVRNTEWRFILSEPLYSLTVGFQMENQVFFYSDQPYTEWISYVKETTKQWEKEQKEGVDYRTIKDEDGNNYFTYTDLEDKFKANVNNALQYIYLAEWLDHAPHSFEYDQCIAGREKLNMVEADGETGCYEIWWRLANDYLYYAQEYENQTDDIEAILYYYSNSIYSCMEALKYAMPEKEHDMIYHFMTMRYHDIYRDGCVLPQEYKERARSIYSVLVETDKLHNER